MNMINLAHADIASNEYCDDLSTLVLIGKEIDSLRLVGATETGLLDEGSSIMPRRPSSSG